MPEGHYLDALKERARITEAYIQRLDNTRQRHLAENTAQGNIDAALYENERVKMEAEMKGLQERIGNEQTREAFAPEEEQAYQQKCMQNFQASAQAANDTAARKADAAQADFHEARIVADTLNYGGDAAYAKAMKTESELAREASEFRQKAAHAAKEESKAEADLARESDLGLSL
ncbi:hypothetical protein AGMMS50256_14790 [Betaproteobacteria bacterium]|nr:hypothetical protein AGMMS50256_14790 [Betaproteobacteria bacterium]